MLCECACNLYRHEDSQYYQMTVFLFSLWCTRRDTESSARRTICYFSKYSITVLQIIYVYGAVCLFRCMYPGFNSGTFWGHTSPNFANSCQEFLARSVAASSISEKSRTVKVTEELFSRFFTLWVAECWCFIHETSHTVFSCQQNAFIVTYSS